MIHHVPNQLPAQKRVVDGRGDPAGNRLREFLFRSRLEPALQGACETFSQARSNSSRRSSVGGGSAAISCERRNSAGRQALRPEALGYMEVVDRAEDAAVGDAEIAIAGRSAESLAHASQQLAGRPRGVPQIQLYGFFQLRPWTVSVLPSPRNVGGKLCVCTNLRGPPGPFLATDSMVKLRL